MELSTIIELLKQAYMEQKWEDVLESIEILQRDEEEGELYKPDELPENDF